MEHIFLVTIIIILIIIFCRPITYDTFEYKLCPNFGFVNEIRKYFDKINNLEENTDLKEVFPYIEKKIPNLESVKLIFIEPNTINMNSENKDNIQIIYNFTKNKDFYLQTNNNSFIPINKDIFISNYAPLINNSNINDKYVLLTIKKPYWYRY